MSEDSRRETETLLLLTSSGQIVKYFNYMGTHQDVPEPERSAVAIRTPPREEAIAVFRMEELDRCYATFDKPEPKE